MRCNTNCLQVRDTSMAKQNASKSSSSERSDTLHGYSEQPARCARLLYSPASRPSPRGRPRSVPHHSREFLATAGHWYRLKADRRRARVRGSRRWWWNVQPWVGAHATGSPNKRRVNPDHQEDAFATEARCAIGNDLAADGPLTLLTRNASAAAATRHYRDHAGAARHAGCF